MAAQLTWYDILDIPPGAPADAVRRAFAAKASVLRPELVSGAPSTVVSATGRASAAIEAARQVLTDPARRRRYDEEIGLRRPGEGLDRPEPVPSERGPGPGWYSRGTSPDSEPLTDALGVVADWLAPHPAPPRRVAVPDVRGLFVGPCRRLVTGLGLHLEIVRLTADPMPVEGLVVGQSPAPGTTARRSGTLTAQVWHPARR
jgi:hypothetical protein